MQETLLQENKGTGMSVNSLHINWAPLMHQSGKPELDKAFVVKKVNSLLSLTGGKPRGCRAPVLHVRHQRAAAYR